MLFISVPLSETIVRGFFGVGRLSSWLFGFLCGNVKHDMAAVEWIMGFLRVYLKLNCQIPSKPTQTLQL